MGSTQAEKAMVFPLPWVFSLAKEWKVQTQNCMVVDSVQCTHRDSNHDAARGSRGGVVVTVHVAYRLTQLERLVPRPSHTGCQS